MIDIIADQLIEFTRDWPWLRYGLASVAGVMIVCRVVADRLLQLAKNMREVDTDLARRIGQVAWFAGKLISAFGFGTPARLIDAQYERKPPRQRS